MEIKKMETVIIIILEIALIVIKGSKKLRGALKKKASKIKTE